MLYCNLIISESELIIYFPQIKYILNIFKGEEK